MTMARLKAADALPKYIPLVAAETVKAVSEVKKEPEKKDILSLLNPW